MKLIVQQRERETSKRDHSSEAKTKRERCRLAQTTGIPRCYPHYSLVAF